MHEDVNDLLLELATVCSVSKLADKETAGLVPPLRITELVSKNRTPEEDTELDAWVSRQLQTWAKALVVTAALPPAADWNLPLWMLEPWAATLGSKWGAGLAEAVEAAELWLATQ